MDDDPNLGYDDTLNIYNANVAAGEDAVTIW